jgi:glutamate synthase domain-containing protein 2
MAHTETYKEKWGSKARVDLLTIDGSGGGMSPWRMMEEWGIPTFYLQSIAYSFAKKLATRGEWIPDLAMAGGFSTEDHIFKVLAMGAPYFNAICMGRALMIPGFVGDNIEGVLKQITQTQWKELPATVKTFGLGAEQIYVTSPPSRIASARRGWSRCHTAPLAYTPTSTN